MEVGVSDSLIQLQLWFLQTMAVTRIWQLFLPDPFKCPPGWRRHERLCYYFSAATDKQSWAGSEAACAAQNADLAFIGASSVESFIAGQSVATIYTHNV